MQALPWQTLGKRLLNRECINYDAKDSRARPDYRNYRRHVKGRRATKRKAEEHDDIEYTKSYEEVAETLANMKAAKRELSIWE